MKFKIALSSSVKKSRLFFFLEKCFPIEFLNYDAMSDNAYHAIIISGKDVLMGQKFGHAYHVFYFNNSGNRSLMNDKQESYFEFSDSNLTPYPFKTLRLRQKNNLIIRPIKTAEAFEDILIYQGHSIWSVQKKEGMYHYLSGFDIANLPDKESLYQYFNPNNFIDLLPLIDFLRNITPNNQYDFIPNHRACIIFDDPNLHSQRYGHLLFKELAVHAKINNYHVSIATIPFDLYYASKSVLKTLFSYPNQLSLLIHGNDHLYNEFGYDYDNHTRIAIIAKLLERVCKFENKYRLSISRVLTAPHGICKEAFMVDFLRCGIEGAMIAYPTLFKTNKNKDWVKYMGIDPFVYVNGFLISNRFLFNKNIENKILLSAYLRQPIIPFGHHGDLKDGLDILKKTSELINRLPNVVWSQPHEIFRSHYILKKDRDVLSIEPLSSKVSLLIPSGIRYIKISKSDIREKEGLEKLNYSINGIRQRVIKIDSLGQLIPVQPGDIITITSLEFSSLDLSRIKGKPVTMKSVIRRIMTEFRDRIPPLIYNIIKKLE